MIDIAAKVERVQTLTQVQLDMAWIQNKLHLTSTLMAALRHNTYLIKLAYKCCNYWHHFG